MTSHFPKWLPVKFTSDLQILWTSDLGGSHLPMWLPIKNIPIQFPNILDRSYLLYPKRRCATSCPARGSQARSRSSATMLLGDPPKVAMRNKLLRRSLYDFRLCPPPISNSFPIQTFHPEPLTFPPDSESHRILSYTWYMDKQAGRSIYRAGRVCMEVLSQAFFCRHYFADTFLPPLFCPQNWCSTF